MAPSGTGCVGCLDGDGDGAGAGWWFHLRRCAQCGHIGCCDSSRSGHARAHAEASGHPIVRSFEPGEDWFWSFPDEAYYRGPELAAPLTHPGDQPVPGPDGAVPADWEQHLR